MTFNPFADSATLVDVLESLAGNQSSELAYEFIDDYHQTTDTITYSELAQKAKAIAAALWQNGINTGERALLIYPPGLDLIAAYFGCLYAGVIAIPVYPPQNSKQIHKLEHILKDADPKVCLSSSSFAQKFPQLQALFTYFQSAVMTDTVAEKCADLWHYPEITGNSLAFLQYTSGSTSQPKGVMVSHKNLITNIEYLFDGSDYKNIDHMVCWLPPYHDMGLISGILLPLRRGKPAHLMSPLSFLANPFLWLKTISKYDNVIAGAPNFAFDYCVRKITEEQKLEIDLSGWHTAYNGAEPIRISTLNEFCRCFASCGFREEAFMLCYGLAETTLIVSSYRQYPKDPYFAVDKNAYKNKLIKATSEANNSVKLVNCGKNYPKVRIVNPETFFPCPEDCIGEIWVQGDTVCLGYWNQPELSENHFKAQIKNEEDDTGYLRTGDLGFFHNNQLYISGRMKDIIIIHGHNYYPQDIELVVDSAHSGIRKGCSIAFSVERNNTEQLVIVCESKANNEEMWLKLVDAICKALAEEFELVPCSIVFIPEKTIPKTTSGKVQRQPCKKSLLDKTLALDYMWISPQFDENERCPNENITLEKPEDYCCWILSWISKHIHQPQEQLNADKPWIEYGLDSIAIIQLIHDLSEQTSLFIEPILAWDYQTPATLANYLSNQQSQGALRHFAGANISKAQIYRLSPGQERLWFIQKLSPVQTFFNIGCAFAFNGFEINEQLLQKAVNAVIQRHQVLRTTIAMVAGKPVPFIEPGADNSLQILKVNPELSLTELFRKETMKPYDLSRGNLIRFSLIKSGEKTAYFLVSAHHIISDAWSLAIVMREIIALYENEFYFNNYPAKQYYDFSDWQHQQLHADEFKDTLQFWLENLKDAPTLLPLCFDKPRGTKVAKIKSFSYKLDSNLSGKIISFCQNERITPFLLFFTTYQLLLAHYSNQQDLIIGIPVSNRSLPGTKDVVGFFVNTLPVRAKVSYQQTVKQLIAANQEIIKECYRHQSVPLSSLISALNIERDIAYEPLFQVLFVMQNNLPVKVQGEELLAELLWTETGQLPYDLTLEVIPTPKEQTIYQLSFKYNEHLFYEKTITAMMEQFVYLLEGLIQNREDKAWNVPLLTPARQYQIIEEFNNTACNYPLPKTIHALFEEQVRKTPTATALMVDEEEISFQELNERANQMAHYLLEKTKPGIIALSQPRSIGLVISFLAVLKSGSSYLYLDKELPEKVRHAILADCQPSMVLEGYRAQDYQHYPLNNPALNILENDLAYVIYTSGTTGEPKGVPIEHGQIADHLHWYLHTPVNVRNFLHLFSFNFDGGVVALWWPLLKGGKVILFSQLKESLLHQSVQKSITALHLTPSLMRIVLPFAEAFPAIEDIILAGEAFDVHLLRQIQRSFIHPQLRIWNLYGVSECAVISCYHQINGYELTTVPIGRPISNTQCYVVDAQNLPVPIGVPGELCIGGKGVGRGYLHKPEHTECKFITLDWPNKNGLRVYKTGDWVRWNYDGELEFYHRIDNQIKLRGYRIELGAIETALLKNPDVSEAVVRVIDERLIAYLVLQDKNSYSLDDIKKELQSFVPKYMLPEAYVIIDKIPLTQNGKIDSKKLQEFQIEYSPIYEQKSISELENKLIDIMAETLKIDKSVMSNDSDFFEVGGDSILSIHFIMLCNQQNIDISLNELYRGKCIKNIARIYEEKQQKKERIKAHPEFDFYQKVLSLCCASPGKIELHGSENIPQDSGMIIATNHLHWWNILRIYPFLLEALQQTDKPYLLSASSVKFLHPLSRLLFHPMYLNRKSIQKDYQVLQQCVQHLKEGQTILISPEGTRNHNALIKGKNGAAYLAIQSHTPVVPVAIYKDKGQNSKKTVWHITVGQPIMDYPHSLDKFSLDDVTEKMMRAIALLLPEKVRGNYSGSYH